MEIKYDKEKKEYILIQDDGTEIRYVSAIDAMRAAHTIPSAEEVIPIILGTE